MKTAILTLATAANDHHDYWIGLNDILVEGQWTWPGLCAEKMAPSFNLTYPWCPGEPNNAAGSRGADCVRVVGTMPATGDHAQRCWADYHCDDHRAGNDFGFVCELNVDKFGDEDAFAELHGDSNDEYDMLLRDKDSDKEERERERGNPAAVALAVIFALAFVTSAFGKTRLPHGGAGWCPAVPGGAQRSRDAPRAPRLLPQHETPPGLTTRGERTSGIGKRVSTRLSVR